MPPGAPAGWLHLANRYGTRPAKELFKAAVHYAREGFPASRRFCQDAALFQAALVRDPGAAATYLRDGLPPKPGTPIKNPALARTLEALAFGGDRALFGGELGKDLVAFVRAQGGVISEEDLAVHQAEEHEPLSVSYRGLTVLNAAPPSMGFALLLELKIAEAFELDKLDPFGADLVHTLVEAKKLAFAEREEFAARIRATPRRYIAQPRIELSTCPTWLPEKRAVAPRRVDLRPYVLTGSEGPWVLPGGLSRVALVEGSYVVNSSQGGGSKDTWVLQS